MSSNIAEALNSAFGKIVELPIVSMVESIRTKMMQWFCIRRAKADKCSDHITPNANTLLLQHHVESAGMDVKRVSSWTFQVNTLKGKIYYVDLEKKSCTCLQFQKLEIPCSHALAAARDKELHVPSLVGMPYTVSIWRKQYGQLILPVPNECDEDIPLAVVASEVIPPSNPTRPGRRRKRRIPSFGEYTGGKRSRKNGGSKCSICRQGGHNRATCKNMQ